VGQERAQGKAMVLCLAHQLAEQLPGMAAELLPVVTEHGNGNSMLMVEAFERWAAHGCAQVSHVLFRGSMHTLLRHDVGLLCAKPMPPMLKTPTWSLEEADLPRRCSEDCNLSCINTGTCCSH